MDGARRVLAVYIATGCWGCDRAGQLAETVRSRRIANLDVRVIDLGAPGAIRPPSVFAVPTYLLDGRLLSLGNPDEAELIDRLQSEISNHPDQSSR